MRAASITAVGPGILGTLDFVHHWFTDRHKQAKKSRKIHDLGAGDGNNL